MENKKKEIADKLKEYFGEVKNEVTIEALDAEFLVCDLYVLEVRLSYEDFKPERTVRRDIEAMFENVRVRNIERYFSDEATKKAIREILAERTDITADDVMKEEFGIAVDAWMFNKEA